MNSSNRFMKGKMEGLRVAFGGKCILAYDGCLVYSCLQFAHKKGASNSFPPRSRGRKERYYGILNHPDDYFLACVNCHRKYDSKT